MRQRRIKEVMLTNVNIWKGITSATDIEMFMETKNKLECSKYIKLQLRYVVDNLKKIINADIEILIKTGKVISWM
jgi:hypothetical protein